VPSGRPERLEFGEAHLYDAGTHLFDSCSYLTDGDPVEWVMWQVDYRKENRWFGAHNETHGLSTWRYADGTRGLATTGEGREFVGCYLRLRGREGCIEVGPTDGPSLRLRRGADWETPTRAGKVATPSRHDGRARHRRYQVAGPGTLGPDGAGKHLHPASYRRGRRRAPGGPAV